MTAQSELPPPGDEEVAGLDAKAVWAACMANINPLSEPSATELAWMERSIRAYLASARRSSEPSGDAPAPAAVTTLEECPPGLFLFNGSLGFKTEYRAMETVGPVNVSGDQVRWRVGRWPDAYVVDSGEVFWGGASKHEDRVKLLVQPIEAAALRAHAPADDEVKRLREALDVVRLEARQRENLPLPSAIKDAQRGTAMALSARLAKIERLSKAALTNGGK